MKTIRDILANMTPTERVRFARFQAKMARMKPDERVFLAYLEALHRDILEARDKLVEQYRAAGIYRDD